jgi:hypothetical protein
MFLYDERPFVEAHIAPAASGSAIPGDKLTGLVVFLCSPEATHLAGQVFWVDQTSQPGAGQQE